MKFTAEYLRSRFSYDPESGDLIYKPKSPDTCYDRMWDTKYAGKVAGQPHRNGKGKLYRSVSVDRVSVLSHRVIWCMINGVEPSEIDHIDGNGSNNRLVNLREVSRIENIRNHKRNSNNASGVTGVRKYKLTGKWIADIRIIYRLVHLGTFTDFFEAVCARKSAELKYEFHENHGSDRPL